MSLSQVSALSWKVSFATCKTVQKPKPMQKNTFFVTLSVVVVNFPVIHPFPPMRELLFPPIIMRMVLRSSGLIIIMKNRQKLEAMLSG